MHSSDEKTIDLMDFFVELLYRWKTILLITIVITILVTGLGAVRAWRGSRAAAVGPGEELTEEVLEEQAGILEENARAALTEVEAQEVERVYRQYMSYIDYRNYCQEELTNFDKVFDKKAGDLVYKRTTYRLDSTIEGVERQYTNAAVTLDDYQKIQDLLPNADSIEEAYKCTYFEAVGATTTELKNFGEDNTVFPSDFTITVDVVGPDEATCEQIWAVVDAAFQEKTKTLKKIDPQIRMELIDSIACGNMTEYYISRKQTTLDYSQRVDSMITNLKLYAIDKFSEEQTAYFNVLRDSERALIEDGVVSLAELEQEDAEAAAPQYFSVKMLALGVLAGLFLSFVYVLARYLFSGTINVGQEMQDYYKVPVLSTVFVKGRRGRGLFPGLINKLLHVDSMTAENKAEMIAADICGGMQKAQSDSVYIVRTCNDGADLNISSLLERAVTGRAPECRVQTGTPLTNVEEMQNLTQQKTALLLVHNKRTVQADVEKVLDLCSRQAIKVLGAVAVTDI